jgi:hypothetical protein
VGAATGIASVSLQAEQQNQLNEQLPQQEEFLKIQKKLAEHQLKQFEDQEKVVEVKAPVEIMSKFNMPTTVPTRGVMTRTMTRNANLQRSISQTNLLSNTGLGPIQRGNIVNNVVPVVHAGSRESLPMMDRTPPQAMPLIPVNNAAIAAISRSGSRQSVAGSVNNLTGSSRSGSGQSLVGSTNSLNGAHSQFARGLQQTVGPLVRYSDEMELRQRGPPLYRASSRSPKMFNTPKGAGRLTSPVSYPEFDLTQETDIDGVPDGGFLPLGRTTGTATTRPSTQLLRTIRGIPGRIRGLFPVRAAAMNEREELIPRERRETSIGRFLNTHKRKLIIGGAVIGGAAIVGGTLGGTLSRILSAKRRKTMQNNATEPAGMFQQLSSGPVSLGGGGGGGGGGSGGRGFTRYNQLQAAARSYVGRKKRGGKKPSGKKKGKTHGKQKTKKCVKDSRVGKRKKALHSINKNRKKGKKSKPKTAF